MERNDTELVSRIENHFLEASSVLLKSSSLAPEILRAAEISAESLKLGGTIFWCGNGGSAADSQHLAAELIGRYKQKRKSLSSIALTTDTSILTAISNDFSFQEVFSRQIEGLGTAGDVLIALSTSGTSQNVLKALAQAKLQDIRTILLTSLNYQGNDADLVIKVSSKSTEQIQHAHIAIGHIICELIETSIGEN